MPKPFIHLHVHTEMSLLDGMCRVTNGKEHPLIDALVAKNMPACAITDHGAMFGVFTFQKACLQAGIEPIIGCELYICEDMHDKTNKEMFHILLLAKDNEGYKNLVKLDSLAYTEGFYYKPRIDLNFLREHSKGLIATSACIGGRIPQYLIEGDYEKAKEYAITMRDIFGKDDFYIEIQDHGIPEEKMCNPNLVKIAREIGVKVVATNDAHYIEKSDAEAHDVLLCVQTRKTIDDPKRMKFSSDEFYLKTYEEMYELFSWCPEALETPFEIAKKCHVRIEKKDLMPPYTPDNGSSPAEFLRSLAYDGLIKRYGEITPEIKERAEYELDIIIKMGFAEYYLIVWDFIFYARNHDIPVGAGRGSGVGSIIAYAIGITNVNPLKYSLLFERFLNPERVSNPDFDIDFCVDGRGEVIDYVIEKYGAEKVCQILALGTMATKNAIKDVARVYNVPLAEVNALTKMIPGGKVKLKDLIGKGKHGAEDVIPEVLDAYENNEQMHKVIDIAMQLEGMPRQCSKHAAGVVICKEVISDFVPLQKSGDDVTTQFQKEEVEEVGMLKMDFLGLRTLTDIKKAKQYIMETTGNEVDFEKLGYDDPNVYELLGSGETDAVFQLESPGMKSFMKQLLPKSLEDIIAGISLYRPGPMDSIPTYINSKNNPEKITYMHPLLEPILNMTYGCLVYQEQVMQVVQVLAGYTYGRADLVRRAMAKKKADVLAKEREYFIYGAPAKEAVYNEKGDLVAPAQKAVDGCLKKGVDLETANKIFDNMMSFASYAFNKSHAAAYAVCAYETAYLKRYYPVEFIAAVINNRITNQDEIAKYVEYLRASGVKVYPPDINISDVYFKCENGGLRYGLMGIKNVGESAISSIVEERKKNGAFKSLEDLIKRADKMALNKRMLESLIKAGALDCFGETRATLFVNYEPIINLSNHDKSISCTGQLTMFDEIDQDLEAEYKMIKVQEYPKNDLLSDEKDMLNLYMSGHPLDEYREKYNNESFTLNDIKPILDSEKESINDGEEETENNDLRDLVMKYDKQTVTLGGMITDTRIRITKSNKSMCMARLEDLYGTIDIVFFPSSYDKYKPLLVKDKIIKIEGELQVAGRSQIVVRGAKEWLLSDSEVSAQKSEEKAKGNKLFINIPTDDESMAKSVIEVLKAYPGMIPATLKFKGKALNSGVRVQNTNALFSELASIVGEENYKLV
ncbi:MAG: DNA polymerase III subunit alpha [Clostridia bacterium]|nr:DNA polymerase III subunit alpha [Clostridia bacterium]